MDKIETLYNSLKDSGDYTKSFESFKSQFGTEQGIKSLHSALSSSGDYTKSLNDFKNQFFTESPLVTKKKSQRVSVGGFSFPTEQKQEDSEPTATKLQGGTLGDRFKKDNFQFDSNKARLEIAQNNIENLTQDESSIYESYLNYTELDPSDIDSAKKEVATPKDKGFFSGVSDGVRNSFIVKSIFGEAEKEKEITLDDLLDKKQRQKRIDFFKTLDSPEKRKEIHAIIELHKFKTDAERKVSENKVLDLHDGIRKLSNQKKELNDKLKSINDSAKYAKTPEELDVLKQQFELINVESQNIEKKGLDTLTLADGLFKKIQSLDNKIGSFEEELNLSKRNYQSGIDALDRLDIGFEQIGANLDYLGRNAFNNLKRNIGIIDGNDFNSNKENIDLGAFQDRDNLQNKREFFTPQKEFSDLNSTSDYFDFVTGTLIDTTPVLAELSLGAPGVALFIAENQQGNTIDIKKGVFDKNKELNNVNELLSKGELSDSEKNKFETRKKQIEDAPELSPVGIFLTASAKTGVEFAFSTIGKFRILTKNRRVLKSLVKNGVKTEIKEGVKKSLSKKLLSGTFNFVKDATGEGLEEYGNQIFNNFLDINVLGDKFNTDGTRKTLLDGALEAGAGGLGVGFIISSPIVGVKVVSEISTQNTLSKLSKNALEINSLYDKLNNEGISKSTRKILKESANSLLIENERLLRKDLDGFDKLDKVKKQNYLDIVRKELGVKDAINELGNSDKSLVSKLQGQLKVLDGQKIDLFQEVQDVKIYKEGIEAVNKEGIANAVPTPHKPINDVSKNINALDNIISDVKDTEKTVDNTKTDEPTNTQDVSQQSLETFKVENQKVETNSNNYIVSIIDGKIDINPEFGTKEVSKSERSKVLDNLLKTTNFDVGTRSLDGLSNIDVNQVVDLVESKSQNPKEIAETLLTTDFEITDITGTVDGAIAETLRGGGVDKASLIEVVGSQIKGASRAYFRKVNGKVSTLDVLREKAQDLTDNEVTIQDVADFIVNNRSPKDFIEGNTNIKETNLKAKFESLTGLKASKKVLESITGIKEATLQENTISNDVPFQKISTQTSIKGSALNNLVDRLKQTGLAKKVELLKDNAIKETLVSLGKDVVVTPNGFTDLKTSTVYLNIDKVKLDTPIHEFAEIYMDDIRKTEPKLHQKGIDLISDSKYFNDLKNNEDYKELSDEDLKHEALIQAIGDSGAKILDASTKSEFVDWLTKLFKKVVNSLGIKGLTAKQFGKITLQEYTDLVGAELLSGKSIENPTNIDVITTKLEAIRETKESLNKKFKDRKSFTKDIQDEITRYIKEVIDNEVIGVSGVRDIGKILNVVRDTRTTKKKLLKSFDDINRLVASKKNKIVKAKIKSAISNPKIYIKKQFGKNKARKIDADSLKQIKAINKNSKLSANEIFDKISELETNIEKVDLNTFIGLHIALDIAKARQFEQLFDSKKNVLLIEKSLLLNESALNEIDDIIKLGKSKLKNQVSQEANRLKELQQEAILETEHQFSGKTKSELQSERFNKQSNWFKRFFKGKDNKFDYSKINLAKSTTFSFEYLLGYIGQKSDHGKGGIYKRFYSGKDGYIQRNSDFLKETNQLKASIKENIETILEKKFNNVFTGYIKSKDLNRIKDTKIVLVKGKERIQLPMSLNQALYVHLVSKMDSQNRQLREDGWNDLSFKQLDEFLGDKYIKMSDYITSLLRGRYDRYNEVHKEILRTDLGFEENYFPTKYDKLDLSYEFKLGGSSFKLPSVMPPNIIEKVSNNNRIDITQNAFDILNEYIESMEHFSNYGRYIKDLNALLNNKEFKNNVESFDGRAYKDMVKLSKAIIGDKSDFNVSQVERSLYNINAGIASGFILFKGWTALKQFLSLPSYSEFAEPFVINGKEFPFFHKTFFTLKIGANLINPINLVRSYRFLIKNSEQFKNRMSRGDTGNEVLKEVLGSRNKSIYKRVLVKFLKLGISPNKLIDMITISTGGKIVYDEKIKKYKKNGLSDRQAKEQAIRDFEMAFLVTQQSSDIANLSEPQIRKGALTSMFVPFKNAQFGYFRRIMASRNNIFRRFRNEKLRLKKAGLSDTKAGVKSFQKTIVNSDTIKDTSTILLYTHLLPLLWQYVASGLPGILTDYDDKDEEELKRALRLGAIDGLFIVNDMAKFIYNGLVLKKNWTLKQSILLNEIDVMKKEVLKASKDSGYFNEDVLEVIGREALKTQSLDLEIYENIYNATENILKTGGSREDVFKLLNAPKELKGNDKKKNTQRQIN